MFNHIEGGGAMGSILRVDIIKIILLEFMVVVQHETEADQDGEKALLVYTYVDSTRRFCP